MSNFFISPYSHFQETRKQPKIYFLKYKIKILSVLLLFKLLKLEEYFFCLEYAYFCTEIKSLLQFVVILWTKTKLIMNSWTICHRLEDTAKWYYAILQICPSLLYSTVQSTIQYITIHYNTLIYNTMEYITVHYMIAKKYYHIFCHISWIQLVICHCCKYYTYSAIQ